MQSSSLSTGRKIALRRMPQYLTNEMSVLKQPAIIWTNVDGPDLTRFEAASPNVRILQSL